MVGLGEPMLDGVMRADTVQMVTMDPLLSSHYGSWAGQRTHILLSARTVWMRYSTAWISAEATAISARSSSWTKANFEVQSVAANRYSLPSVLRSSATSRWKKPIGWLVNFFLAGLSLLTSGN